MKNLNEARRANWNTNKRINKINWNFSGIHGVAFLFTVSRLNWNLEMLVFVVGGKLNNKLNPPMTLRPGIEPMPHWWEGSALTTAPSLLPQMEAILE